MFGDTLGRVVFKGRDWQTYEPAQPVDGTIGNIESGDACPTSWLLSSRRRDIVTRVELKRTTDEASTVWNDAAGQSLYGVETFALSDLICSQTVQMSRLALRVLRTRGYRVTPRIERVTLNAATSQNALDVQTFVTPYTPTRLRCRLQLPRGQIFGAEMHATGVRHQITPDAC